LNVGEYGVHLWFSTGFDMRGFTSLSIIFTKPDQTVLTVTNPAVSVGAVDENTVFGLFPANKYLDYVFVEGQVDQVGVWGVRCTYTDGSQHLISDPTTFTIRP